MQHAFDIDETTRVVDEWGWRNFSYGFESSTKKRKEEEEKEKEKKEFLLLEF